MRYVNGPAATRELLEQCGVWLCQFDSQGFRLRSELEQEAELGMLAVTHSKECCTWCSQFCFKCR